MADFRSKRVLVTGATGFIGSALTRSLLEHDAEVSAVSRSQICSRGDDIHWLCADLSSLPQSRQLFASCNPHVVFHLASEVTGSREIEHVASTMQANLRTAVNVMTCATEIGIERLVLAGSMEEPDDTDSPPIPTSPYAAAKWAATAYGRLFHALYGTPVVMARLFMVYGPGQEDKRKLIPYVTTSLLSGKSPAVTAGHRAVDWIFLGDVVTALMACGSASGIEGKRLDIGTGKTTSVRKIVDMLNKMIDPAIGVTYGRVPERKLETTRVADLLNTNTHLNWHPQTDLENGLRKTIAWYRARESNK